MKYFRPGWMLSALAGAALALGAGGAAAQDAKPQKGGTLDYVVPAEPPSFDGHRETTFALIHPIAPFYSLLVRVNPENPSSPTDIVCDLCVEMPEPTNEGTRYTFKIREGVKFHDGSDLTAEDVLASFQRIIFPPEGVASARQAYYPMVEKISAPDDRTVVFDLKYPSGAFIPALAIPFNFIYSKDILDKDQHWYEQNVMGSGPFKFEQRQPGAFISGVRYDNYHHEGQPYLDGFKATFAKSLSLQAQAIRGNRAAIQFRGFPPNVANDLKTALGDRITVQTSDWNCVLLITPNHKVKPFDDVRVRRALTLAVDRWGGSDYLSKIAIVRTVGGVVFPNHPLAASKEQLQEIAGYWPDLEKSRAEARRLLKEAGVPEGFSFTLNNRAVEQPYSIVGTWLIDQWRQIGLNVTQRVQPTGPFYATLREKEDFQVSMDFNCQSVVNPLLDVSKFLSDDISASNYANYTDRELDEMYVAMNRTLDENEQRRLMRAFEKRVLDEQAHMFITLWWFRIVPHRSYVKGWKISPSHYLNQQLDNVWLDKSLMQ